MSTQIRKSHPPHTYMKNFVRISLATLILSGAVFSCSKKDMDDVSLSSTSVQDAATPKSKMSTPTITCGENTDVAITVTFTAGATGAPAGFSLQWMTADAFVANGNQWYASDNTQLCKASFSGNANLSRYELAAGESVTVKVGEFLLDNGASTNCSDDLVCGTVYVFRAFAHANSTLQRSEFTGNLECSTEDCESGPTCTFTQGYWKTHGPVPTGNNTNQWAVTSQFCTLIYSYRLFSMLLLRATA
jgi:hypothetical protein